MHELGHVFNLGNSSWNWNDEMFANFRMQYGLEQNQGKVWMDERVYTGREILDMYKKDYDNTVYTQVNDNGIHYMLGRLAGPGGIGWEPFKAAFRELSTAVFHRGRAGFDPQTVAIITAVSRRGAMRRLCRAAINTQCENEESGISTRRRRSVRAVSVRLRLEGQGLLRQFRPARKVRALLEP